MPDQSGYTQDHQPADEMISIGKTARLLGVSVDTVRRWEADGLIRATRTLGNQRRFNRREVEQLAARAS